jgi:hypothetical protein
MVPTIPLRRIGRAGPCCARNSDRRLRRDPDSVHCHPDGAGADSDATGGTADGDRLRERVRLGVDSGDAPVQAVRDPD